MPKRKLVRDVRFTRGFVALGPFRGSRWVLASPDSPKHLVSVGGTILVTQDGAPHPRAGEVVVDGTDDLTDRHERGKKSARPRKTNPHQPSLFDEL